MTEQSAKNFCACLGVLFMLLVVIGVGCNKQVREHDIGWDIDYGVRVIGGCQYIVCQPRPIAIGITHKGNCTNSIHIYRVENK